MRGTRRSGIGAALVVLLLLFGLPASGAAATFTALYAFGDSLSDTGNIAIATGGAQPVSPPYDPQRFTNRAPVAVEVLAASLGLTVTPSLAGGTNFAFGGARTGLDAFPPGLLTQVGFFMATVPTPDPDALYFVFAGGNDLRDAAANPPNAGAIVGGAVANIGVALDLLYGHGARHFFVPNLPNIGRTPEAIAGGPAVEAGATFLSMLFNEGLSARLDVFEQVNPGVNLVRFDTFGWLEMLVANAFSFGFVATTQQCIQTAGCNPEEFIFWDGVHPTGRAHEIFGNAMAQAVPEPAILALLALGLAAGSARRRARR